jgi:hypothetical protein
MRKYNKTDGQRLFLRIWGVTLIILTVILVSLRLSEASGGDEKPTEGYVGPERIKLVESPVGAKSGVSDTKGWIGDKRVRLRTVQRPGATETRGWVDREYIHVKKRTDND